MKFWLQIQPIILVPLVILTSSYLDWGYLYWLVCLCRASVPTESDHPCWLGSITQFHSHQRPCCRLCICLWSWRSSRCALYWRLYGKLSLIIIWPSHEFMLSMKYVHLAQGSNSQKVHQGRVGKEHLLSLQSKGKLRASEFARLKARYKAKKSSKTSTPTKPLILVCSKFRSCHPQTVKDWH